MVIYGYGFNNYAVGCPLSSQKKTTATAVAESRVVGRWCWQRPRSSFGRETPWLLINASHQFIVSRTRLCPADASTTQWTPSAQRGLVTGRGWRT